MSDEKENETPIIEEKLLKDVPPAENLELEDIIPDLETIEAADESDEETVDIEEVSTEELIKDINERNKKELNRIFDEVPDIDIAEACEIIDVTSLIRLFRMMPSERTAELFEELSQDKKEELIKGMTDKELVEIINEQYADDIADAVGDMPANLAARVLKAADKNMRKDINTLLKYQDDTAGAVMTTEFLEFKQDLSVKQTIEQIRNIGKDAETIYTIFVRDSQRQFVGTVDLDDLIFAKESQKLQDIMNKDAPTIQANTDREEVAVIFRRYDLNAIAVLNNDNRLVGVVTVDDAIDVMIQETNEDIESMNQVGTLEDSYLETSPWDMAKKCFPWLIILMVLGTFSSMVLSRLEDTLGTLAVLTAFITVLMDTGGNSGGQTIALMIRGLSLKEFGPKDFGKIIWKELKSSIITASIVAVFGVIWFTIEQVTGIIINTNAAEAVIEAQGLTYNGQLVTIWQGNIWSWAFFKPVLIVSVGVSLTLFVGVIFSKVLAICLPLLSAVLKKDPAIVSQPLLTTIIDVLSLLTFFLIAQTMIFPLLGL